MHADNAEFRAFVFQFTPLREGRLSTSGVVQSSQRFQFTPLREGRRLHSGREPVLI